MREYAASSTCFFVYKTGIGNVPLLVELIIDIMFASNVFLGRRSIYPDYEFGLLFKVQQIPQRWNAFAWIEAYP